MKKLNELMCDVFEWFFDSTIVFWAIMTCMSCLISFVLIGGSQ